MLLIAVVNAQYIKLYQLLRPGNPRDTKVYTSIFFFFSLIYSTNRLIFDIFFAICFLQTKTHKETENATAHTINNEERINGSQRRTG